MNLIIIWLLFMNKILQLWIFWNLFTSFPCFRIHAPHWTTFFVILSIAQFCAITDHVFTCKIMQKLWLKFYIHAWFLQKSFFFKKKAQLCENWFHIDSKLMRNFVDKKSFCAKTRNCCAREFVVSWKPKKTPIFKRFLKLVTNSRVFLKLVTNSGVFLILVTNSGVFLENFRGICHKISFSRNFPRNYSEWVTSKVGELE